MPVITNTEFSKVFKTNITGEGEYGSWQLYDCYVDAEGWDKTKLAFFETVGKTKLIPERGMAVQVIEYKEKQKGEYTNYTITKIVPVEETASPQPKPQPMQSASPTGNSKDASFYVAYAKDILVALIASNQWDMVKDSNFEELCKLAVGGGLSMLEGVNSKPNSKSEGLEDPLKEGPDDPFGPDDFAPPEAYNGE